MNKKWLSILVTVLLTIWTLGLVQATPLDLSTFSADGDVTVSEGTVTIDETSGLWASYFYDDFFFVEADALSLSIDYELSSGIDDVDWLVTQLDYVYDLEVTGTNSGTYVLDLTPYQDSTISLAFGLEADWLDWSYDSVATFSNFDLITVSNSQGSSPVPEPATIILFGSGLVGLIGAARRKRSKEPA